MVVLQAILFSIYIIIFGALLGTWTPLIVGAVFGVIGFAVLHYLIGRWP